MQIIKDKVELRAWVAARRANGEKIALVPTMGALHEGHISLIRAAREKADAVIVYIFVNPLQFGPNEDFGRYPRPWERDVAICRAENVDMLYAPSTQDVYPQGFATAVSVKGQSAGLEAVSRPWFFDGVATVLTKMFSRIAPDMAFFGEKDYQQLQVVKKLVRDLDLPIEVVGVPTGREADGLAKSSRNLYLSKEERAIAPKLYAVMQETAETIKEGTGIDAALAQGREKLTHAGFKVDYLELRDAQTLEVVQGLGKPARLLAAAWLGATRLIDNMGV